MRQRRSQPARDVDWVDVTLVEDEAEDEFLSLLHSLALEAMALRAATPGGARPEPVPDHAPVQAQDRRRHGWPRRRHHPRV